MTNCETDPGELLLVPGKLNLTVYKGDPISLKITLRRKTTLTAIDLTGKTTRAQIRTSAGVSVMSFTTVITDAVAGKVTVSLSAVNSALLPARALWDFEVIDDRTYLAGTIKAKAQVSQ